MIRKFCDMGKRRAIERDKHCHIHVFQWEILPSWLQNAPQMWHHNKINIPYILTHYWKRSILYKGKTERCQPLTQFPEGFDIWHSSNRWAYGESSVCFMKNIILPYISTTRKVLSLGEHMAVVKATYWQWNGTLAAGEWHHLRVIVPNYCTDALQPMDLSVSKPLLS